MPDLISISLSGLQAFQRALETTSHNVANANTPGYNRQVTEFVSRLGQGSGDGYIGGGTQIATVVRIYDNMLGEQFRLSITGQARFGALEMMSNRVDSILADPDTGLNSSLQSFFNATQDLANDPASIPTRQALISEADGLASRFQSLDQRLASLDSEVSSRIENAVADIGRLADSIAKINDQIAIAQGSFGQPPNDLLDQRDELVRQLSGQVSVTTTMQDDGAMNVFIGSGQTLVIGNEARSLAVRPNEFDPTRIEVTYEGSSGTTSLDNSMAGGVLGGLLEFRDNMLDPARQALGQTAAAFASQFNQQHMSGMDLRGNIGEDFFTIDPPGVLFSGNNSGSGSAVASITDIGAINGADYILEFDGAAYSMRRADSGQPVALAGSGTAADPFVAEGLSVVVAGAPAAGDQLLIRPSMGLASSLSTRISDPQAIAMAAPTRSQASMGNLGDATITQAAVVDASDPGLLSSSTIEFLTPTTYSINGAGSFSYTDGEPIILNGSNVSISGEPATGDVFSVAPNFGATGDNANGLLLADIQSVGLLDGGTISINENYSRLVSGVGGATRQIQANLDAQNSVLASAENAYLERSGVNLDEEAANLIKYQQAYQAVAQVVNVAKSLFDSLLNATSR